MADTAIQQAARRRADVSRRVPALARFQKRLRCFGLPAAAWDACVTVGDLQAVVKPRYHALARHYHPDQLQHRRLTLDEVIAVKIAWMDGVSIRELARRTRHSDTYIARLLAEETGTFADDTEPPATSWTFRQLAAQYAWLMQWPATSLLLESVPVPETPRPARPRRYRRPLAMIEQDYARLMQPLGEERDAIPLAITTSLPGGWQDARTLMSG